MDHRLRVRQRFSGFYDVDVREDAPASDIDGANFDAQGYVSSMLATRQLPELVAKSNELSTEIKELDSDMQMLVYENYNKFISATETIQQMKTEVDSMDADMARLGSAVADITASSTRINANLAERRVRIQKLNGVRRLLKKLSFIFDLPTRLARAVELGAHAQAVRYWVSSTSVLRAYANLPAFQAVEAEASTILAQLAARLNERLSAPASATPEAFEAGGLLLELGRPAPPVRAALLAAAARRLDALGAEPPREPAAPAALALLDEAKDLALSFTELFGPGGVAETAAAGARGAAGGASAATAAGGGAAVGGGDTGDATGSAGGDVGADGADGTDAEGDGGASADGLQDFAALVAGAVSRQLDALTEALAPPPGAPPLRAPGDEECAALVCGLQAWHDALGSVDAVVPAAGAMAAAEQQAGAWLLARLRAAFAPLHAALADALRELAASGADGAVAGGAFAAELRAAAARARPLLSGGSKLLLRHQATLAQALQDELEALCADAGGTGADTDAAAAGGAGASGEVALRRAVFWAHARDGAVQATAGALGARAGGEAAGAGAAAAGAAVAVRARAEERVQAALLSFVRSRADAARPALVAAALDEALGAGGAGSAEAWAAAVAAEVEQVIAAGDTAGRSLGTGAEVATAGEVKGRQQALDAALGRLAPRGRVLGRAVAALLLVATEEELRGRTLTQAQQQALSAHTRALAPALGAALGDDSVLGFFVDEVEYTAIERCTASP